MAMEHKRGGVWWQVATEDQVKSIALEAALGPSGIFEPDSLNWFKADTRQKQEDVAVINRWRVP